ncbi:MAG: hypothetical protein ACKVE3_01645 [Dissulfuribacterales bacterium]
MIFGFCCALFIPVAYVMEVHGIEEDKYLGGLELFLELVRNEAVQVTFQPS